MQFFSIAIQAMNPAISSGKPFFEGFFPVNVLPAG
jgi:hypothetical protein